MLGGTWQRIFPSKAISASRATTKMASYSNKDSDKESETSGEVMEDVERPDTQVYDYIFIVANDPGDVRQVAIQNQTLCETVYAKTDQVKIVLPVTLATFILSGGTMPFTSSVTWGEKWKFWTGDSGRD
jgi:hypothetical protein